MKKFFYLLKRIKPSKLIKVLDFPDNEKINILIVSETSKPVQRFQLGWKKFNFLWWISLISFLLLILILFLFLIIQNLKLNNLESKYNSLLATYAFQKGEKIEFAPTFEFMENHLSELQKQLENERNNYAQALTELSQMLDLLETDYINLKIIAGHKLNNSSDTVEVNDSISVLPQGGPISSPKLLLKNPDEFLANLGNEKERFLSLMTQKRKNIKGLITQLVQIKDEVSEIPKTTPISGIISSGYGYRKSPRGRGWQFHKGIDIMAGIGDTVYAPANGVVIFAGDRSGYGRYLIISHGDSITTHYGHLSSFTVQLGDVVKKGMPVGLVGETGKVTGPHLHYEIRFDDIPVDPEDFIKTTEIFSFESGKIEKFAIFDSSNIKK